MCSLCLFQKSLTNLTSLQLSEEVKSKGPTKGELKLKEKVEGLKRQLEEKERKLVLLRTFIGTTEPPINYNIPLTHTETHINSLTFTLKPIKEMKTKSNNNPRK